jgi:hypothetical protein
MDVTLRHRRIPTIVLGIGIGIKECFLHGGDPCGEHETNRPVETDMV